MHPTTVSQELALVAVITLSFSAVINLFRVLFPAHRRRSRRQLQAARAAFSGMWTPVVSFFTTSRPRKRVKSVIGVANS